MAVDFNGEVHPAAAVWPMLPEPDLRRLADDIQANGLRHPIILDAVGRLIDGRNRLAACQIAGVEPTFVVHEGDPVALVLSENNERRHLSLPERAAAAALTLATEGHRQNGRWTRFSIPHIGESANMSTWQARMKDAGMVLDYAPDLLPQVVAGELALDAAVKQATELREHRKRRTELPDDLGALVDAGELDLDQALRRAALTPRYAARVASGDINIDEAEILDKRDERDHQEAIARTAQGIVNFLDGWTAAVHLANNPNRDAVLDALSEYDRDRFLTIEKETTWPSTQT